MTLSGAQALVGQLEREGVRHVFGVPGVQLDHVLDALARARAAGGPIEYIAARHEQGAAHMAEAYARTSGRPGVCLVVPGPGVLNALPAVATGYACSSPMLCLAADIPSPLAGRGLGMLHELPDQHGFLASLTKWSGRADTPARIPGLVREAIRQSRSGRPRPVALTIPADVLAARAEVDLEREGQAPDGDRTGRPRASGGPEWAGQAPDDGRSGRACAFGEPEQDALSEIAAVLRAARRPLLYAGGGVLASRAGAALIALAEELSAPVVMSRNAGGAVPAHHGLAFSSLAAPRLLPLADAVLVVGSRFLTPRGTAVPTAPDATVALVNADPADLGAPRRADLALRADAREALEDLRAALVPARTATPRSGRPEAGWSPGELAEVRAWCARKVESVEPQWSYVRALREAIPDDGFLVNELTQVGYLAAVGYPVHHPGTFLTPGYQGTLGYGYPSALGVKVGNPDRAVVSVNGDGGFCWNMQELATARKYGIGVTAVVFNDNAYGNVRRIQADEFEGRFIGSDLTSPDFVRLAESFGVPAVRADTPARLVGALRERLTEPGPSLIEVPVAEMPSVWPLLLGGTPGSVRD
ncbi:thiamine pyrophosphate-dependent enzyme [Streptomyces sp. V4I2]|uniref:thiamine pyrophosphate-dependent enzyme n=1 Tax=Streptomyces sp. V4I2 TaxID=3042280 RepID=UPI0027835E2F|nr:thiamine pyrophosphate-dependent enzyme [Streptomyces sp. V4I2]MDQ1049094.1 acetolactate synthase-1/2/3 large subunit [Streptomyces sp. V4I2]